MGKYDNAMYEYLAENEKFADLFNGAVFEGEEVLRADQLENDSERHTGTEGSGASPKSDAAPQMVSRYRDIKKRARNGARYVVFAIENLSRIDHTIPWRVMEYDVLEYGRQIREIESKKGAELEGRGMKYTRIASGYGAGDRLHPVYTICFYHGLEKWNGPRSLSEMIDFGENEELRVLFHDYPLTLICAEELTDLSVFQTDLRLLLKALPLRKDKRALRDLFSQEEFKRVSYSTAKTIAIMMDDGSLLKKIDESEEEINMCQALEELKQDWKQEGIEEGIEKGIEVLILDHIEDGFPRAKTLGRLMKRFGLSEAAAELYYEKYAVRTS